MLVTGGSDIVFYVIFLVLPHSCDMLSVMAGKFECVVIPLRNEIMRTFVICVFIPSFELFLILIHD